MTDSNALRPSYFKSAFCDQHNLILIFGLGCFSAAYATLWPLLLGLGGEVAWLACAPKLSAFRRWVDERASAEYLFRAEAAIQGALPKLSDSELGRFLSVSREAAKFAAEAGATRAPRERLLGLHALLELRRTFLDYAFLRQRIWTLIDVTPSSELEREAARLQQAYAAERELTLRMTLRKALAATKRRIAEQAELSVLERRVARALEALEEMIPSLRKQWHDSAEIELAGALQRALDELGGIETLETALDHILERPLPDALAELRSGQTAQEGPRLFGPMLR